MSKNRNKILFGFCALVLLLGVVFADSGLKGAIVPLPGGGISTKPIVISAPAAPSNLALNWAFGSNLWEPEPYYAELKWDDNSSNETGWEIQRDGAVVTNAVEWSRDPHYPNRAVFYVPANLESTSVWKVRAYRTVLWVKYYSSYSNTVTYTLPPHCSTRLVAGCISNVIR